KVVKCSICGSAGPSFCLPSAANCVRKCSSSACIFQPTMECATCVSKFCDSCIYRHAEQTSHASYRAMCVNKEFSYCRIHFTPYIRMCSCQELLCESCEPSHLDMGHNCVAIDQIRDYDTAEIKRCYDELKTGRTIVDEKIDELEKCVDETNESIAKAFSHIIAQITTELLSKMNFHAHGMDLNTESIRGFIANLGTCIHSNLESGQEAEYMYETRKTPMIDIKNSDSTKRSVAFEVLYKHLGFDSNDILFRLTKSEEGSWRGFVVPPLIGGLVRSIHAEMPFRHAGPETCQHVLPMLQQPNDGKVFVRQKQRSMAGKKTPLAIHELKSSTEIVLVSPRASIVESRPSTSREAPKWTGFVENLPTSLNVWKPVRVPLLSYKSAIGNAKIDDSQGTKDLVDQPSSPKKIKVE
ncbi:hypothetical protein PFISCL1PPCAC_20850, partial [Pristionchus fissidentatus]